MKKSPGAECAEGLADGASVSAQATMAFLLRLRERGIANLDVLRALEMVPRLAFVAHRHADLALRDMALPIGCGQAIHEPFLVARMLESLELSNRHRVLEIGAGSGYTSALLGRLAHEVIAYERFRTLAMEAKIRLDRLGIRNVHVLWGDAFEELGRDELFDRILVDGIIDHGRTERLVGALAESGLVLSGTLESGRMGLSRIRHVAGKFEREFVLRCALFSILEGKASAL